MTTNIYTDGACSLRHGGWAWVNLDLGVFDSGYCADTTNQRMELFAALRAISEHLEPIVVHSDSAYLVNCFNQNWQAIWEARGWRNAKGLAISNQDLWKQLFEVAETRSTTFVKVRGHSGDPGNDEADRLAVRAMEDGRRGH